MILRKLFAIYICARLRHDLIVAYCRVMWAGFKADCRALWSVR